MNFYHNDLVEKVKPKIVSVIRNLFSDTNDKSISNVFDKKSPKCFYNNTTNRTKDVFIKNNLEDDIFTPVNKKVWINGKEYNVMATSQNELNQKIQNINSKKDKNIINNQVWFENYGIA